MMHFQEFIRLVNKRYYTYIKTLLITHSTTEKMSMLSTPDVVMVVDNNSVPFVPPLPTSLNFREFNYLPSLNAIDVKQEVCSYTTCNNIHVVELLVFA